VKLEEAQKSIVTLVWAVFSAVINIFSIRLPFG
jgi:hypothetical protein